MYWVTESSGTVTRQGVKSGIWLSIQLRQLLEERRVWFLCVSVLLLWLFLMLNEWISRSYKHIVTLLVVLAVFVFLPGEFNYEQAIQLSQLLTGHNINTMYLVATNKKRCRHFINSVIIIIILLNTCNPLSLSFCSLQKSREMLPALQSTMTCWLNEKCEAMPSWKQWVQSLRVMRETQCISIVRDSDLKYFDQEKLKHECVWDKEWNCSPFSFVQLYSCRNYLHVLFAKNKWIKIYHVWWWMFKHDHILCWNH